MSELTHFDAKGDAHMVDISSKDRSDREAIATARITMNSTAFEALRSGDVKKGDVLGVARIAGIQGAKSTSALIPLCHPLMITKTAIEFEIIEQTRAVEIQARVKTSGQTGVEMEALCAVNIAALTIYDMLKAVDKSMVISDIRLLSKRGGKSGDYTAK